MSSFPLGFSLCFCSRYRFPEVFCDTSGVREMQNELDDVVQHGVQNLTQILRNTETSISNSTSSIEPHPLTRHRTKMVEYLFEEENYEKDGTEPRNRTEDKENNKLLVRHNEEEEVEQEKCSQMEFRKSLKMKIYSKSKEGKNIADVLLKEGVITRKMLEKLKKEIKNHE